MSATMLPTMGQQDEGSRPQVATAEDRSAQEQVDPALRSQYIQPAETNTASGVEPDLHHQEQPRSSSMVGDRTEIQAQHAGTDDQAAETSKPASEFGPIPSMKATTEGYNNERTRDSSLDREHNTETGVQEQRKEDRNQEERGVGERSSRQEQERSISHQQGSHARTYQPEQSSRHQDVNNPARETAQVPAAKPSLGHPHPEQEAGTTTHDQHRMLLDHENSHPDSSKNSETRHHDGAMRADERMNSPEVAPGDPMEISAVVGDATIGEKVVIKSEDQELPLRAPTASRSVSPPASTSIQPQVRRHSAIDHGLSRKPDKASPPAKRATTDSEQSAPTAKIARVKRELGKKLPKVYPPRKPRVRPAPVESLTMTIRTDSALSTLASAAVAIKNHQGPLSTLSVPQSPTVQAGGGTSVATADAPPGSASSTTTATTSATATTTAAEETDAAAASTTVATASTSAATEPPLISGRSPFKEHLPQDAAGYRCELCPGERFGRVHDLKRHQISKHNEMTWPCDFCHRPFVRRDALLRHYSVKAARNDGVHPTLQEEDRLQEAKARAKLLS